MDVDAAVEEVKRRGLMDALDKVGGELEADKARRLEGLGLLVKAEGGYAPTPLFYEVLLKLKPLPSLDEYGELLAAARHGALYADELDDKQRVLVEELVKRGWLRVRYELGERLERLFVKVGVRELKPGLRLPPKRWLWLVPAAVSGFLALKAALMGYPLSATLLGSLSAVAFLIAWKGSDLTRRVVRF